MDSPFVLADTRFNAARRLLDLARRQLNEADIERHSPDDPGTPGYIDAFTAILRDGDAALREDFDVTETIGFTRWSDAPAEEPRSFLWFRILTCTVELLIQDAEWPNYGLASLLGDLVRAVAGG